MAQWIWALIVVLVVVVVVAAVWGVARSRTRSLQNRFGPEYDRTVASADDRRRAEAALADRAKRHDELTIVALPESVRLRYAAQWRTLQEQFVDRPSAALTDAEGLVTRVMQERGYPVDSFDEQADLVSVDHPGVVENYRVAHEIQLRNQTQQASTEDMREAMLRYRSLFDDLLRADPADGESRAGTDGALHDRRR